MCGASASDAGVGAWSGLRCTVQPQGFTWQARASRWSTLCRHLTTELQLHHRQCVVIRTCHVQATTDAAATPSVPTSTTTVITAATTCTGTGTGTGTGTDTDTGTAPSGTGTAPLGTLYAHS